MTRIKHILGNVLRLCIPLRIRTVTVANGRTVATDAAFTPNPEYPVSVVLSNGAQQFKLIATMANGNVACIEDNGMLPLGTYSVAVLCKDDNGNPLRFKERNSLEIVGYTSDAGYGSTDAEVEIETAYLNAAVFLMLKGEDGHDGRGIDHIDVQESQENGGTNIVTIFLTDGTSTELHVKNGSWEGLVDTSLNLESGNPIANAAVSSKFDSLVFVSSEQLIISNAI